MTPERYAPCPTGLHACGISADEEDFITVANFPMRSQQRARAAWRQIKAEFEDIPTVDADLILDLMEGGVHDQDIGIRRQWLNRIKQIVEAQNA